jgi:hypothetical protein
MGRGEHITKIVTPAKAGVQGFFAPAVLATLDPGFRRDDINRIAGIYFLQTFQTQGRLRALKNDERTVIPPGEKK